MIYTSYFSKVSALPNKLPNGFVAISIAGKSPSWYSGAKYRILAPKYWFYAKYKEDGDSDYYTEQYYKEVLNNLNADRVVNDLYRLKKGISGDIVLLCYESPSKFCHRHLVAEWLNKNGYECEELKF